MLDQIESNSLYHRPLKAVLTAWLVAGTLDIAAALIYYPMASGVRVETLLQGIASGVLGDRAFAGGIATAALGLSLHYLIALGWTVVFLLLFRRLRRPFTNLFYAGMAYGILVWFVMNMIVLPLSRVRQRPFDFSQALIAAVILMFCIGLPIATIVGTYHRAQTKSKT